MANNTGLLQRFLESVWYANGRGRCLLIPFSYVYRAINSYQRKTQSQSVVKLACPVIVVGNITVGGTGKTPLTIYLVKLLQKAGYKPAIITRGYGGKATHWPQRVTADSDASLVGDEAVLMAQRTGVAVYAGADRLASVRQLLNAQHCDVIVSDDGMQHYKLPRDMQIAVIDGERQLGNGYCLPAGPLREKKERLNSCDLIVLNGKSNELKESNKVNKVNIHEINIAKQCYEMNLSGQLLINLSTHKEKPLSDFNAQKVQALTGIGNPRRFYASLQASGLELNENSFPDHYAFQASDLTFADDVPVIMTEKDAVKCKVLIKDLENYWYLPVTAQLTKDFDESFLDKLKIINDSCFGEK